MSDAKEQTTGWKRARRPEQIDARREAILSAARRLLEARGLSGVALTAVAKESGLSKANLYRYFESREAILLELFEVEIAAWSDHFSRLLERIEGSAETSEVAQAVADSLENRETYCELFAGLASDIEPRLSESLLIRSRRSLRGTFVSLIEPLRSVLPHLSKAQLNEFLTMHAMFQAGVWPHASPGETLAGVMSREEFVGMRMHFSERVRWHALVLFLGLESVSQPRVRPSGD